MDGEKVEYEGYWKNDKRDGSGTGVDTNGYVYKGDWRNDDFHGKGSFKTAAYQVSRSSINLL